MHKPILIYFIAALGLMSLFFAYPFDSRAQVSDDTTQIIKSADWYIRGGTLDANLNCTRCRFYTSTHLDVQHISSVVRNGVLLDGAETLTVGDVLQVAVGGWGFYTTIGGDIDTPFAPLVNVLPGYDYNRWKTEFWGNNSSEHKKITGGASAWLTTVLQHPSTITLAPTGLSCSTLSGPRIISGSEIGLNTVPKLWVANYQCEVLSAGGVSLKINASETNAQQWVAIIADGWAQHGCNDGTRDPAYDGTINIAGHRESDGDHGDYMFPNPWPDEIICRWDGGSNAMFAPGSESDPTGGKTSWTLPGAEMQWHFLSQIAAPTNITVSASCQTPGTTATTTLSTPSNETATYFKIRLNDLVNPWSATCTAPNTGDICNDNLDNTDWDSIVSYALNTTAGHQYEFWAAACNSTGCSAESQKVNFACEAAISTSSPPTIAVTSSCPVPGTTARIRLDSVPTATYFKTRLNDLANPWSATCTAPNAGDTCNDNLDNSTADSTYDYTPVTTAGRQYEFWAAACNSTGCSAESPKVTFTCEAVPPPSVFNYSISEPSNITVTPGTGGSNTISLNLISAPSENVSLSISGLPFGASATFSPTSCQPTCTSGLTLNTTTNTPTGNFTITVKGESTNNLIKTETFSLIVDPPPPPDTGEIKIHRVNTALNLIDGASAWVDDKPQNSTNPSSFVFAISTTPAENTHTAYVTDWYGYEETLGSCTYVRGKAACNPASFGIASCDGTKCQTTFTAKKDEITKMVVKYRLKAPTGYYLRGTLDGNTWPASDTDNVILDASIGVGADLRTYFDYFQSVPGDLASSPNVYKYVYKSLGPPGSQFKDYTITSSRLSNPITQVAAPSHTLVDEETAFLTFNFDSVPTALTVNLLPLDGYSPFDANISADVTYTGDPADPITYVFWWNCNNPSTNVNNVINGIGGPACGDPEDPVIGETIGKKFTDVTADPQDVMHTYICNKESGFCPNIAKIIARRGTTPQYSAEDRALVSVLPTLIQARLSALPANTFSPENISPADFNLDAFASLNAPGKPLQPPLTYTFWWNCDHPGTNVSDVINGVNGPACGDPDGTTGNEFGQKLTSETIEGEDKRKDTKSTTHRYTCSDEFCTFTPKVIIESQGGALPGESRDRISIQGQFINLLFKAVPNQGTSPLDVSLQAQVTGTAFGPINYTFWWNCPNLGTTISEVVAACGDPETDPNIGAKFNGTEDNPQIVSHQYSCPAGAGICGNPSSPVSCLERMTPRCYFAAKVIVERGEADPKTNSKIIVVTEEEPIQQICTNECLLVGQKECKDSFTLHVCGNFDADDCLEWGADETCNEFCSQGVCVEDTGGLCRNGVVDLGEECDTEDFNNETCVSRGFVGGGLLNCNPNCTFNTLQCRKGWKEIF